MKQAKILLTSFGAAGLALGFSLQPHPAPFWETNIVIAGEESVPQESGEDSSAAQSAKMGKDEGTQTGGANQGPENDTQKIDQPPRQNPTTGQQ